MKNESFYSISDELIKRIEIADEFLDSLRKMESLTMVKVIKGAQMLAIKSTKPIHEDIDLIILLGLRTLSEACRAIDISKSVTQAHS